MDTGPFHGVVAQGALDVVVRVGERTAVELEGQMGLLDLVTTEVRDGVLHLRSEKCWKTALPFVARVTTPGVDRLELHGSGDLRTEGPVHAERLQLRLFGSGDMRVEAAASTVDARIKGSGDMHLHGRADRLEAEVTGSGDLNSSALECTAVDAHVIGSGDATVNATTTLRARITGSGDIRYSGDPANVDKQVTGSGDIKPER